MGASLLGVYRRQRGFQLLHPSESRGVVRGKNLRVRRGVRWGGQTLRRIAASNPARAAGAAATAAQRAAGVWAARALTLVTEFLSAEVLQHFGA
jgi:hypothetical protein